MVCSRAIIDIDKVIKIIRGSDDAAAAKDKLIKDFKLNDESSNLYLGYAASSLNQDEQD
jgi:DNA gyrase/topoisomerase IV subunit A